MFKAGDTVEIYGHPDSPHNGLTGTVTNTDGNRVWIKWDLEDLPEPADYKVDEVAKSVRTTSNAASSANLADACYYLDLLAIQEELDEKKQK